MQPRGLRASIIAPIAAALLGGGAVVAAAQQDKAAATRIEAAAVADAATDAGPDAGLRDLLAAEHKALLASLSSGEAHLSSEVVEHAKQSERQGRRFWQASGYDFAIASAKQADIALLEPFTSLPPAVLDANMAVTAAINNAASAAEQDHAVFDADGLAYLFFAAEALGPKLGQAFLAAYDAGEIAAAAALIKASEVPTGEAKKHFGYPRPFIAHADAIRLVPDRVVAADGKPYTASGGAYPSGHTMIGATDTLLLAMMLPERFAALVARGENYGYSRVVLGVHYPLDVIGSRMIALRNVSHDMNDAGYRALFAQARDELRAALEKRCGEPLAACAAATGSDPWTDTAKQGAFNGFVLTYGLPRAGGEGIALALPEGAEALLEPLRPDLSAAARRSMLERTALASGGALDASPAASWQRIDLYAAALAALAAPGEGRQSKAD